MWNVPLPDISNLKKKNLARSERRDIKDQPHIRIDYGARWGHVSQHQIRQASMMMMMMRCHKQAWQQCVDSKQAGDNVIPNALDQNDIRDGEHSFILHKRLNNNAAELQD